MEKSKQHFLRKTHCERGNGAAYPPSFAQCALNSASNVHNELQKRIVLLSWIHEMLISATLESAQNESTLWEAIINAMPKLKCQLSVKLSFQPNWHLIYAICQPDFRGFDPITRYRSLIKIKHHHFAMQMARWWNQQNENYSKFPQDFHLFPSIFEPSQSKFIGSFTDGMREQWKIPINIQLGQWLNKLFRWN